MSLADVHAKGLFSLVIAGTESGNLTRVFIATKKLKPFQAQLHTHRYDILLGVVRGRFQHHLAEKTMLGGVEVTEYSYRSPLNGGAGLSSVGECRVNLIDYVAPQGSLIEVGHDVFHTVSCSKGAIWVVQEQGFVKEESRVLGIPFVTEGLYNKPEQFSINDHHQTVLREINQIVKDFERIEVTNGGD